MINNITLRPYKKSDVGLLYNWQTEPHARQYSRNPKPPSLQEHKEWFSDFLGKKESYGYIILNNETPSGFIRLDQVLRNGVKKTYEVSIMISSQFQKGGIGSKALEILLDRHADLTVEACIFPENKASLALFGKFSFIHKEKNCYIRNPR